MQQMRRRCPGLCFDWLQESSTVAVVAHTTRALHCPNCASMQNGVELVRWVERVLKTYNPVVITADSHAEEQLGPIDPEVHSAAARPRCVARH